MLLPIRTALAGDTERFLERTAKIQWGLMICVYFVSYVPALLMLDIPGYEGQNAKLLFFLVLVVQLSDVCSTSGASSSAGTASRRRSARTRPGRDSSAASPTATLLGTALWWATPFAPWQAALMALVIA